MALVFVGQGCVEVESMRSTTWLRVSFRVGAAADGIVAAAMFAQAVFALPSPVMAYLPEAPYRYAMGLAGSLMSGWTILLLWADRRPVERRGVLLITVVVVLGLMGSGVAALSVGLIPARVAIPLLAFQVGLIALFTSSYLASWREHGRSAPDPT